jgi:hypothetical protein
VVGSHVAVGHRHLDQAFTLSNDCWRHKMQEWQSWT